ncbi:MAG: HEAT repeat domain-containing protein, partial [Polyangiales bacterium]
MTAEEHLDAIFTAERELRRHERALLSGDAATVGRLLAAQAHTAARECDGEERRLRLERLADLCAQVPGEAAVDALIQILDDDDPTARVAAGEALLDVAQERFAAVARAIESRIEAGEHGPAMRELPFVLAEIPEPGSLKLMQAFLRHPDAEVVAAAIDASAEFGDPDLVPALTALCDDAREIWLEEDAQQSTIAVLARQALDELGF